MHREDDALTVANLSGSQDHRRSHAAKTFESLSVLIDTLNRWAHRRLPHFARRRMDTGDLVQESILRALRSIGDLGAVEGPVLKRYLMVCVNNLIRDEIRRSGAGEVSNGITDIAGQASPLCDAIESEDQRRYRTAISRLSEDDQVLLVGRLDFQISYEDLARATGRPTAMSARAAAKRAALRLARAYSPR